MAGIKLKFVATWDAQQKAFVFAPSELDRMRRELPVFDGREISLEIKRHSTPKTQSQLGYYFSAIIPWVALQLRKEWGDGVTEVKTRKLLEGEFLKDEILNESTGEIKEIARSISELSKAEMGQYIEDVNGFCLQWFNAPLPEPLKKTWILPN